MRNSLFCFEFNRFYKYCQIFFAKIIEILNILDKIITRKGVKNEKFKEI